MQGRQPKHFANSVEASTMNVDCPEFLQPFAMFRCRVAFVCAKTIAGILLVEFGHVSIARRLGDNRRSRDACGQFIAMNDSSLWARANRNFSSVDEAKLRHLARPSNRALHREQTRVVN